MPEATDPGSRSAQILGLSRELLDDIELSRLQGEGIVLKAARLARLTESAQILEWLGYELRGYPPGPYVTLPVAWTYINATARLRTGQNYLGPLATQEAEAAAMKLKLQALRVPDVSYSLASANPHEHVSGLFQPTPAATLAGPMNNAITAINLATNHLAIVSDIRGRVIGLIHAWVVGVYHERLFSGLATTIFEQFKRATDKALGERCGDALVKIPHVYERLMAGDKEAVSHALTTCRRVIVALADALYPPREPIERSGKMIELTEHHTRNRLREYLRERVSSAHRFDRLNHTLTDFDNRFGAGVHDDVDADEARALLLGVYVFVGEVVSLPALPPAPLNTPTPPDSSSSS